MGSFNLMFLGTKGFAILHNNGLFHQLDYEKNKLIAYFLKYDNIYMDKLVYLKVVQNI